MTPDVPRYMTTQEVADYFRVTTKTIQRWRARHTDMPRPFRPGGVGPLKWRRDEIEAWETESLALASAE